MPRFSKLRAVAIIVSTILMICLFRSLLQTQQRKTSQATNPGLRENYKIVQFINVPRKIATKTLANKEVATGTFPTMLPNFKNSMTAKDRYVANILENFTKPHYKIAKDKGFGICGDFFKLRKTRITDIPKRFPIPGTSICSTNRTRTLFVVPSVTHEKHFINRLLIRKTWASSLYFKDWQQHSDTRLLFFFGSSGLSADELQSLRKESTTFGDIVVGDFNDTYSNLSLKMAVILTWIAQNCPKVQLVVKVDMDTFVNIDLLLSLVQELPTSSNPHFVFGHLHVADHPPVLREGAWAVPEALYPYDEFPKYVFGHSYVVSGPAVRLMARSFPFFPIVPNEDAFITGVMPVVLNITRFYHYGFATIEWDQKRTFCQMVHNRYVTALVQDTNREKLWDAYQSKVCSDEFI